MTTHAPDTPTGIRRKLIILVLYGIAFGFAEAGTVIYVRATYEPTHQRLFPDRAPDDLFPLFTMEQWTKNGPPNATPVMEVVREFFTIVMVTLLACAVARDFRQGFAAFMLAFGVWDIAYYGWLKVLIGWPRSLLEWDLIFAAPLPWVGPVWAPLLVAVTMVVTACIFYRCESTDRPIRPRRIHWILVLSGAVLIMVAFWWDARSMMQNGIPHWFNWPLLLVGLGVGLAAFGHAVSSRSDNVRS